MTRKELFKLHQDLCSAALELAKRKNADYAGQVREKIDPFANFRLCEAMGVASAEAGILVRLSDKFARLATFCMAGQLRVKDESVRDTALDILNYTILLMGLIQDRKEKESG